MYARCFEGLPVPPERAFAALDRAVVKLSAVASGQTASPDHVEIALGALALFVDGRLSLETGGGHAGRELALLVEAARELDPGDATSFPGDELTTWSRAHRFDGLASLRAIVREASRNAPPAALLAGASRKLQAIRDDLIRGAAQATAASGPTTAAKLYLGMLAAAIVASQGKTGSRPVHRPRPAFRRQHRVAGPMPEQDAPATSGGSGSWEPGGSRADAEAIRRKLEEMLGVRLPPNV